ncbi:uncharacterized protein L969DRAFT_616102 [Mixia osmundae IAM 14324]|uniref:Uncharacterized protein n=1 Tax=Mixia osmundae (strain CBS 9802 / IAM 14324 / JCM 22182 / KY 12970) TaxID=764103 RepID=G7DTW9_MIXOS|nr:uncharacterized protein L969DRAFT_616102 [Mixia osmundae IAM 14324]KEI41742.1 hypothetical protein L969DRAFT_616102 [Mixia osmundae IAM 14324]GAA94029.1 hypothetical protein E5Q_00676 [Mixia osmundae IAM 14324]
MFDEHSFSSLVSQQYVFYNSLKMLGLLVLVASLASHVCGDVLKMPIVQRSPESQLTNITPFTVTFRMATDMYGIFSKDCTFQLNWDRVLKRYISVAGGIPDCTPGDHISIPALSLFEQGQYMWFIEMSQPGVHYAFSGTQVMPRSCLGDLTPCCLAHDRNDAQGHILTWQMDAGSTIGNMQLGDKQFAELDFNGKNRLKRTRNSDEA